MTATNEVSPRVSTLPRLWTLAEVCSLLGVGRRTLNLWIAEGRLPVLQIGPRSPRVSEADLAEFIQSTRRFGGGLEG